MEVLARNVVTEVNTKETVTILQGLVAAERKQRIIMVGRCCKIMKVLQDSE